MKKFKMFIILLSLVIFKGNAYAATVDDIKIIDSKNVELHLNEEIVLPWWEIDSEIKFLKNVEVTYVEKDFNDQNKLILNLNTDLEPKKIYNLITIIWPDINFDFVTWDSLIDFEVPNINNLNSQEQWLNRLVIKDEKTIELYFNSILQWDEFEFRLLNELNIKKMSSNLNNVIYLNLNDNVEKLTDYLIMLLLVEDNSWNEVVFDEVLYEKQTDENVIMIEDEEEDLVDEWLVDNWIELDSAQEEPIIEDDNVENWNENILEDVALQSEETPDTWPETTILFLLTFGITTVIYIRKKILKI